jgi:hypothetical protein
MKLKLFFAATIFSISAFASADAYQSEVGASVARWNLDGLNSSSNNYEFNGKYYFNLVRTDNLPLAEAAYLGKNSNVFAAFGRNYGHGYSGDSKIYSGGVEVYIPENFLYLKVDAAHSNYSDSSDNNAITTIGLTPLDGLRVTTSWDSDESYHANIAAKYVTAIGGGQFINLEASVADTNFGTYKSIGGDFYFDNTFSVGAQVSDDDMGTNYSIRTRKFFSEQFSGELSYADTSLGNEVAVGVSFRF